MAQDRTTLRTTAAMPRRPAVSNRVQRGPDIPRSPARTLQERIGNRGMQILIARSIASQSGNGGRVPVSVAAQPSVQLASAQNKTKCGVESGTTSSPPCECMDCRGSHQTVGVVTERTVDQRTLINENAFTVGEGALVGVDTFLPESPTDAQPIAPEPLLTAMAGNVLPFPSSTPLRQTGPRPQILQPDVSMEKSVVGQAHELSSETIFSATRDTAPQRGAVGSPQGQTVESPATQTGPASAKSSSGGQVVKADTLRSQAMIVSIAQALHQRVSGVFGGLRARLSGFFTESSAGVQQFIATKQAQVAATVAETVQSIQAVVERAASAAEATANSVREMIDSTVQRVVSSLQTRVQAITDQIIGVMNRFPQSSLPGVSQLRSVVAAILRRAASAVTAGLSRVSALISAALAVGMRVIQAIIGAARRFANEVISRLGNVVQRILQVAFQMLSRIAASIISALHSAFNLTILPILNRLEGMIHQAIRKAEQHAISALRSNRDEYLASVSSGGESDDESASDALTQEALDNNRQIVQTFRERSSTIIGMIVRHLTTAASQIVAHIRQALVRVRQLIDDMVRESIQTLRRIVQAVSSFIQSVIQAVTSALTRVVGFVRALIQSPLDQLLRFGEQILRRMIDFITRIIRNLLSVIAGSAPAETIAQFLPTPVLVPEPTFDRGPIPIPVPVPVPVPVPTPTPIPPTPILLIIVIIIVLLLLLLLLIYLIYWLIRRRKRRKRPPQILHKTKQRKPGLRTRTTIGVGEEVFLEYTHGKTTWATTGGKLSKLVAAKVRLDAPDTAGTITVTAGTESVTFMVLAPSGVFMDRRGGMKHTVNRPNSGIRVRPYLMPDTVNFYRVIYHEMDIAFSTSGGAYSCNPGASGHCGKGGGGVPCDDLPVKNAVVAGRGTETVADDCAFSGSCPGPATSPGSVFADIPHEYKVKGPTGGAFHAFPTVHQNHSLAADLLTLTTTKASASGTIKVTDPTSNNGC